MARDLAPTLHCRPLRDLVPRLLAGDGAQRKATLLRAEALHDSLEPDSTYPVDYLAFRLTDLRRNLGDPALLLGSAVSADLRRIIDALSRGLDLAVSPPESRTAEDWAARLEISTRTLARWRKDGLRWRWLTPASGRIGRRQIGFTAAAIEFHQKQRPGRVERAVGFSQLSTADREALLHRAESLATKGRSLSSAAAEIAADLGRAHETVRQQLLHAEQARARAGEPTLFPAQREKLSRSQLRQIRRARRRGEALSTTARNMGLKPAAVRRATLSHQTAVALRLRISTPAVRGGRTPTDELDGPRVVAPLLPAGLPAPLAHTLARPPCSAPAARALARGYRDARARALRLRADFRPTAPPPRKALDAFLHTVRDAADARRVLTAAALPELVSVALRHLPAGAPIGPLVALLDAGLRDVVHEVDAFDPEGILPLHRVLRNRLLRTFAMEDAAGRAHRRDAPERFWWRLRPLVPQAPAVPVDPAVPAEKTVTPTDAEDPPESP